MAVLKRDKSSVRICGDFSVAVNPASRLDRYPIPKPEDPFTKLANGKQFVDAHSKWIEAICTPSTSSASVIEVLSTLFSQFGVPEMIVTDNGTGFVSTEFEEFLRANGVKHTTSAPYHPASNGLTERAVQIVKKGLKKWVTGSMSRRLAKVLFSYRMTLQTTTGTSPAELLLGRRSRTRMDLLRPNVADRVEKNNNSRKLNMTEEQSRECSMLVMLCS